MDYGNSSDKVMYLDYGIHMTRIAGWNHDEYSVLYFKTNVQLIGMYLRSPVHYAWSFYSHFSVFHDIINLADTPLETDGE